jgi:ankyrin repeat protein
MISINQLEELIFERDIKEIEQLLQSKQIEPNAIVSNDRSALSLAASCGYTDVMKCFIRNGADVNLANKGNLGYTPLEEAAREGKIEALKLLIEENVEIDKGNTINTNALIGACICAKKEAVEFLLNNGANINHADRSGQTALHYICQNAQQWGSLNITKIENNITEQLENPRFNQHTIIFNLLLESKADVNALTNYGLTPLHLVAHTDTYSFIAPLIDKGANVNYQNSKGFSPLHAAADKGNIRSCIELINHGADINITDSDGFTPILGATSSRNIELVRFLLQRGAVKDIKSKITYGNVNEGDHAVMVAEKIGDAELIDLLR